MEYLSKLSWIKVGNKKKQLALQEWLFSRLMKKGYKHAAEQLAGDDQKSITRNGGQWDFETAAHKVSAYYIDNVQFWEEIKNAQLTWRTLESRRKQKEKFVPITVYVSPEIRKKFKKDAEDSSLTQQLYFEGLVTGERTFKSTQLISLRADLHKALIRFEDFIGEIDHKVLNHLLNVANVSDADELVTYLFQNLKKNT